MLDGAVHNNAAWVAAVHAAHGHASEIRDDLWLTLGPPLPFYPNAVTLTSDGQQAQTARLRALAAAGLPPDWGVKDSFASLDLAALGFEPLFEAQWIGRPARAGGGATGAGGGDDGTRWMKVKHAAALALWERAWRADPGNATESPPLFLPGLLADPDIAFLGACTRDAADLPPIAGLIVNRSGEGEGAVAGVSNLFLPEGNEVTLRGSGLAAAEAAFAGLPLVGYEHGAELEAMRSEGFVVLGPLRVWEYAGPKR